MLNHFKCLLRKFISLGYSQCSIIFWRHCIICYCSHNWSHVSYCTYICMYEVIRKDSLFIPMTTYRVTYIKFYYTTGENTPIWLVIYCPLFLNIMLLNNNALEWHHICCFLFWRRVANISPKFLSKIYPVSIYC